MKIRGGSKFFDKVLDITGSFMFLIEGEFRSGYPTSKLPRTLKFGKKTYIHENKMNIVRLAWFGLKPTPFDMG